MGRGGEAPRFSTRQVRVDMPVPAERMFDACSTFTSSYAMNTSPGAHVIACVDGLSSTTREVIIAGKKHLETLVLSNPEERMYEYSVASPAGYPVSDLVATVRVQEVSPTKCALLWEARYNPVDDGLHEEELEEQARELSKTEQLIMSEVWWQICQE